MNPFKKDGQILPIASINSIYAGDILARDLFRSELLINEIQKNRDFLGFSSELSNANLLLSFDKALNSKSKSIKDKAYEIAMTYSNKLAEVIITLKSPSPISIENNTLWTKEHWDFWKNIERIYFVGGLTTTFLTNIFFSRINEKLKDKNINDLKIVFIQNSINLGTAGLSTLVESGEFLIFDFGQTNIKRRHIFKRNNKIVTDRVLDTLESEYLYHNYKSLIELQDSARELDNYIVKIIIDTINDANFKSDLILMGIANYIFNGEIYLARGGYGKLAYISHNYEQYLSKQISWLIKKTITVKLFHDTSAMALTFNNDLRTAVISLGTAFGIAFP